MKSFVKENFYVYLLKDPRDNLPFYDGKGIGQRMYDHKADDSVKGRKIKEILDTGAQVITHKVTEGLTEVQAFKLEAELIALLSPNGNLLNKMTPSGNHKTKDVKLCIPNGAYELSQCSVDMLKKAIYSFIAANDDIGVTNAQIAEYLGLRSSYGSGVKDYLTYSLLGLLLNEKSIYRNEQKKYFIL